MCVYVFFENYMIVVIMYFKLVSLDLFYGVIVIDWFFVNYMFFVQIDLCMIGGEVVVFGCVQIYFGVEIDDLV